MNELMVIVQVKFTNGVTFTAKVSEDEAAELIDYIVEEHAEEADVTGADKG